MKKEIKKMIPEEHHRKHRITKVLITAVLMALGLILFKFIPMGIYGKAILFDASMHITIACLILYLIYMVLDRNKNWKIPYFLLCFLVLAIISFQRLLVNAHNDIGLLLGLAISIFSILIPNYKQIKLDLKW